VSDSDHTESFDKKEETISKLSETELESKNCFRNIGSKTYIMFNFKQWTCSTIYHHATLNLMRRMKEMSQTGGGGMFGMGICQKCTI
jgi:molecular chaperone HtpG